MISVPGAAPAPGVPQTAALLAAQAAARQITGAVAGGGAAPAATSAAAAPPAQQPQSLKEEDNMTISGSTQRFLIMQKLARSDMVRVCGCS